MNRIGYKGIGYILEAIVNLPKLERLYLNNNEINCVELDDPKVLAERKAKWEKEVRENGEHHPSAGKVDTRLLNRMRSSAVSAVYGAGMHPNRNLWVNDPRKPLSAEFVHQIKY